MSIGLGALDPGSCFEDSIAEGESHETRYAELNIPHITFSLTIGKTLGQWRTLTNPLKGHAANMVFFGLFDCIPKDSPATTRR